MASRLGLVRYGSPVGVTPRIDYVWSVYVQAATSPRYCHLRVRWKDAGGALLGEETSSPVRDNPDTPTRLVLRVKAPLLAATADLLFGAADQVDGELHYWDGAQWERGQIVTAYGPRPGEILPGTVTTGMVAVGAIDGSRIAGGAITGDLLATGAVGNASIAPGAITSRELAEGAVMAENVFANAVTASKIAANAVTARVIAAEAVVAGHLAANAVTAGAIAADAVTADKIAANAVTARVISAGAITTQALAVGSVQASQIAAQAITADKMRANSITAQNAAIAVGAIGEATIQDGIIGTAKIKDAAIVSAKVADAAIVNAKIGNLAVDNAKIGNVAATKISTGALIADVTVSGRLMTATTGARVQLSGGGLHAYNSSGAEVVAIRSNGTASFKGNISASDIVASVFRTQAFGGRVEIRGDVFGAYDMIRWYHDNGSITGEIRNFLGEINAIPGMHINAARIELGHTQSVIYQTGFRDTSNQHSRVRAGVVNIGTVGGGPAYVRYPTPFTETGRTPNVQIIVHALVGQSAVYPMIGASDRFGFNVYLSNGSAFVPANRNISYVAELFFEG